MVLEPMAAEEILPDNHRKANEHCVGDAYQPVKSQSIAAEDEAADDGLQQIVGQAHTPKDAKVMERAPDGAEGIPGGDGSGGDE